MPVTAYDALAHTPTDPSIYWIDFEGDERYRFEGGELYIDGQSISLGQLFAFRIQANASFLQQGAWIFNPGAQCG